MTPCAITNVKTMTLIGITGLKKSGKTTFAQFLEAAFLPRETHTLCFADALKDEVAAACGVTRTYLEDHKDNFRLILQGWGTDFRRNLSNKEYWTSRLVQKAVQLKHKGCEYVLIPDTRFHNEADVIRNVGGILIRVIGGQSVQGDFHPSELEQMDIKVDEVVNNNKNLASLKQQAITIATRLKLV